jgi:FkbH-like protein
MIVISATFVAEPLASPLAFMLAEIGLQQEINFAPYHQVFQELLTPTSDFGCNCDGTNIALIRLEDFVREAPSVDSACQAVDRVAGELGAALERFSAGCKGSLLLVVLPPSPAVPSAVAAAIEAASAQLRARIALHDNIEYITPTEIESVAGEKRYDARRDELAHIPFSDAHFSSLALALSRRIHALRSPAAKVLVLDCDNTLWRGVVGEDGVEGIALTPAYLALQEFAVAQQRKGILLCLASKNSESDVLDVFTSRSDMHIQMTDVVAHRINWLPKSANLRTLGQELNLGLDAFVFMDDNPLECATMRAELPQVVTLQVPPEAEIVDWLGRVWAFDKQATTEEDARRTQMYRENAARRALESNAGDIGEFLAALDLQVDIQSPQEDEWQRIEQLTQRTNQFNFTTRRRSVLELKALLAKGAQVLRVRVSDRFGDYGLVGVLIAQPQGGTLVVDTFLLSCRVLGRGVEHAMLRGLGERAHSLGLSTVELELIISARNEPARAFVDSVANAYAGAKKDVVHYRVPVAQMTEICHRPGHDPDAVVQARLADDRKGAESSVIAPNVAVSRSQRYTRLASVLVSGEALLQEISLQRRRPRALGEPATPASSPMEIRLKTLWEEILSIDELGVEDDYFALGGTSLQSVKLFSEIERLFGVQLRLTTILGAPTVRTLAHLLEPTVAVVRSGIVPLRTGRKENIFLVHDGLGETLLYLNLAQRLPSHLSVFGIEPRRLPGIPLAHTSMDDMAAYYVQQIQSIQPAGPYRLGGMCAGGVIAYAMAARLRSQGQEVEVVTILDAATPQAPHRTGRVATHRLSRLRSLLQTNEAQGAAWKSVFSLAGAVLKKASNALRYESSAWFLRRSIQLRFRLLQKLLVREKSWPRWVSQLSVAQIYSELSARYVPPILADVPVLLVRASHGKDDDTPYKDIYQDDDFGWRQVAGRLTLANVAGGHASMLQDAHVDSLAAVLLAYLPTLSNAHQRSAA